VKNYGGKLSIVHPEMEPYDKEKAARQTHLQPVYSTTEKLNKKNLNTRAISKLTKTWLKS
jgi:ATP-dependent DNA helicase RecG